MKLIDKAAVVAEIGSMLKFVEHTSHCDEVSFNSGRWKVLTSIKDFIDTLEVKEVDLDSEIRRYRMGNPIIQHREESLYDYMANVAKHFFELGLSVSNKAQKGE